MHYSLINARNRMSKSSGRGRHGQMVKFCWSAMVVRVIPFGLRTRAYNSVLDFSWDWRGGMLLSLDFQVKRLGLMPKYQTDGDFKLRVKMLAAVAVVPVYAVVATLKSLATAFFNNELPLFSYFEPTWIGQSFGGRGLPLGCALFSKFLGLNAVLVELDALSSGVPSFLKSDHGKLLRIAILCLVTWVSRGTFDIMIHAVKLLFIFDRRCAPSTSGLPWLARCRHIRPIFISAKYAF